ncbi:ATP-binding protein [Bacillus sp. FJAT-45037]|uniref:ATP-binding protein n=1 Tax=Bacillus sp. FJAT-45037 TaxID=2011007 RepID=UPI0012FD2AD8|nr:ATP-binding protein [Bacillus sp. FJAT-45037]
MRQFINKLFIRRNSRTMKGDRTRHLTYRELEDELKREYLAHQISLYYRSNDSTIMYWSEQMLQWANEGCDIPRSIQSSDVIEEMREAMYKAYKKNRADLFASQKDQTRKKFILTTSEARWKIYRDVIYAATQGKLLLCSAEEVQVPQGHEQIFSGEIKKRSDIPNHRNEVKNLLEQRMVQSSKMMNILLVLSEAMTNVIKHAERGNVAVFLNEESKKMYVIVEDSGPGFPLESLPKKTLLAGYSTKKSLGQGFSLMMRMTKEVLLHTSPTGSTIVLMFDL